MNSLNDAVVWRKIGSFSQCYSGATPNTKVSKYWEGGTIPWMRSGEIHQKCITSIENYITEDGYIRNEGNMEVKVDPYEISYRIMLPKKEEKRKIGFNQ